MNLNFKFSVAKNSCLFDLKIGSEYFVIIIK